MATESIQRARRRLEELDTGASIEFTDHLQGVKGMFLEVGDSRLELLEPLPGDTTLEPWLDQGNRLYQMAFEVEDLDREIALMKIRGVRVVREARPAVAFDGRRVAFLLPIPGMLIELIEAVSRG